MAGTMRKLKDLGKKGATAIEFALVAPVLFLLLLGMLEFGLTIFIDSTMQQALRAVARQGMVKAYSGQNEVDALMQQYMQGTWRSSADADHPLQVCVRVYPNIISVQEPKDANGNRVPGNSTFNVQPQLAGFADDPASMFNSCGTFPSPQDQRNAIVLYTAKFTWGGRTNLMTPFVPETLNAVTIVRNEFGT